jgi:DnaJ-class molecular chaperone
MSVEDIEIRLTKDLDSKLASEEEVRRVPRKRKCLMCRDTFDSAWAGERVCKRCKSSAAWRGS